jgi:acyl-CoA synthetase (AMP-forming)/AMP-acid ligase II
VTWTSTSGTVIRDVVPRELRRRWVDAGHCPDRDVYTLFREQAAAHPERAAVIDEEGTLDYGTLHRHVRSAAAALAGTGLGPHDIIGVELPNGRRAVVAELAVAAIGAVALPVPPGCGRITAAARADATIDGSTYDALPLNDWPAWKSPTVDPEAPARIMSTSGTEAEPKLIAYSHNAMAGGRGNYIRALHSGHGPTGIRSLVLVPLSSSYGSLGSFVTIARLGGTLVLLPRFDAGCALHAVAAHRPTHLFGVPGMLARIAQLPRLPDEDLSSLRLAVSSGATLPEETARTAGDRLGVSIVDVYGSADGMNCFGRPRPEVADIRIRHDDGTWAAPGEVGEVCALGPMTPMCYVNAPELDDRHRLPGGWVRSGDRGFLGFDGRLHVVGRTKQVVGRGAANISPAEVERELGAHPTIADVACVGLPDREFGERLCACVVQHGGAFPLTLEAIREFLRTVRGLPRQKLPERLLLLPELPLGPTGKPCRTTLASLALTAPR